MRQRVISGVIFGCIVMLMLSMGYLGSTTLLLIVNIGCSIEYSRMSRMNQTNSLITLLLSMVIFYTLAFTDIPENYLIWVAVFSIALHILAVASLYIPIHMVRLGYFLPFLYFGIPLGLMVGFLKEHTEFQNLLLFVILMVWTCDSTAYFVGSKFGKHKLFQRISPGKTWEGFIGAGIGAVLLSLFWKPFNQYYSWALTLGIGAIVWVFGAYGDLFESSLKRKFGVKDSGNFIPGHGGFYDRFDAFIFVLPFVVLLHFILKMV
ncbi:MAG: phosphatidate cytidylyltransferase [Saprospiraceae bacterium]|nr:phosphatidate cytidylyltransferase [Saprospiraceae bacterium]MCB9309236.1 phosphatidate cytidylyltransferase [Lewinellaceae bacterium]